MANSVTLQDIASQAGVSKMTVSLALRNHPKISPKTKQKILTIAEKLGYQKNPLISAWMQKLRHSKALKYQATLCFLATYTETEASLHHTLNLFQTGFLEQANQSGYRVDPIYLIDEKLSPQRLSQILSTRDVRGIVVVSAPFNTDPIAIDWDHFCSITIGHSFTTPALDRVAHNLFHGIHLIMKKFLERGYQKPAFFWSEHLEKNTLSAETSAFSKYQNTFPSKQQIPLNKTRFHDAFYSQLFFEAWFKKHQPDFIIAPTPLAKLIYDWKKKDIPHRLGLVTPDWTYDSPQISGIDQNCFLCGQKAASLLASKIERNEIGLPAHPLKTLLDGAWVEGESVKNPS